MDPLQLGNCGHSFCTTCISEWLTLKNTCPCCRTPVNNTELDTAYTFGFNNSNFLVYIITISGLPLDDLTILQNYLDIPLGTFRYERWFNIMETIKNNEILIDIFRKIPDITSRHIDGVNNDYYMFN